MWTALFSVTVFALIIALGDFVSTKTKGVVGTVLVAMIVYTIGFNVGLIPKTSLADTGLLTITSTFGMLVTVTNLGTMVEIRKFLKEWRIVVLSIVSLAVMGAVFLTAGTAFFGLDYALTAYPPVAGGMTATVMVADYVTGIGKEKLASFAWFLATLQMFVGIPAASFFLKRYAQKLVKSDEFRKAEEEQSSSRKSSLRVLPPIPEKYNSANTILAKLLLVTCLAAWLGKVTPIPAAIGCLVLGVLGCEIGFLDRQSLQKCGMLNLVMFCMMASAPNSFASLSFAELFQMVVPVAFFLVVGAAALSLGGVLVGRVLGFSVDFAIPLALNAMFGFPFNIMITDDVVRTMDASEEDKAKLKSILQPQMTIAGFASMTIMSVVIAALVIRYIH